MKKQQLNILIVDDLPANLVALERTLEPSGARVIKANSGEEALAATLDQEFALAILDIQMPGMDGYELAELLRGNPETKNIPIIFLTAAYGENWQVFKGYEAGAVDYLVKPFLPEILLGKVRAFLEMAEIRMELRDHRDKLESIVARRTADLSRELAERRKTERSLRESEARYRALFENSMDAVMLGTPDGLLLAANPAACQMFDRTEEELCRLGRKGLVSPQDTRAAALLDQLFSDGQARGELNFQRRDGSTFPGEVSIVVFLDYLGETRSSVIIRDLTKEKRAEADRDLLLMAIEQAGESIEITDKNANIVYVNPAFEQATGYSREEVLGQNPRLLKSGEQSAEFYRELWQTINGGATWSGRFVNRRKDGTLYHEDATISPVFDTEGTIQSYVAVKRDITEHLTLTTRLQHAQKLEAIGTLSGGIAHDFNNILTAILGFAEISYLDTETPPIIKENLKEILQAGKRATGLVHQILTIARQSEQDIHPFQLQYIVKEALKLLRPTISTNIKIETYLDMNCPEIMADPGEIHQVIMNLCVNANHAMRDRESADHKLTITVSSEHLEVSRALQLGLPMAAGKYVKLTVADTGCGMDEKTMIRIFDPYFTTKSHGEGTGLGLATAQSIVKRIGGNILVKSKPGSGTTFTVYLPISSGEQPTAAKQVEITTAVGGNEHILVVDDELPITRIIGKTLTKHGYQVTIFNDSRKALKAFSEAPEAFDALITDMNMPHLLGLDLARAVLAIKPLPIILCTGYSEKIDQDLAKSAGICNLLFKPIDLKRLSSILRQALDQETPQESSPPKSTTSKEKTTGAQ